METLDFIPRYIESESGEVFEIAGYKEGMLMIKDHSEIAAYDISAGEFYRDLNGHLIPAGVMAKSPVLFALWRKAFLL